MLVPITKPKLSKKKSSEKRESQAFKKNAREEKSKKNLINLFIKTCNALYKRKIVIIGENFIEKRAGKGPLLILSTHNETIEFLVIQAMIKHHVKWLSALGYSRLLKSQQYLFKIPIIKKEITKLGNIEINKDNLTVTDTKKIIASGIDILTAGGILGAFPKGYDGTVIKQDSNFGHASSIYMVRKAEEKLGQKIPIILVSIAKSKRNGKYYVVQRETILPQEFNRKKLIEEYMTEIENTYNNICKSF